MAAIAAIGAIAGEAAAAVGGAASAVGGAAATGASAIGSAAATGAEAVGSAVNAAGSVAGSAVKSGMGGLGASEKVAAGAGEMAQSFVDTKIDNTRLGQFGDVMSGEGSTASKVGRFLGGAKKAKEKEEALPAVDYGTGQSKNKTISFPNAGDFRGFQEHLNDVFAEGGQGYA